MRTPVVCLSILLAFSAAAGVSAHHSGAMFDMTKKIIVHGTVKQWSFAAPHSWLIVTVTQPDGHKVDWALEGGGPSGPLRQDTFKPGDEVSVETFPMRDGRPAGMMGVVTFADGHKANERRF